MSELTIIACPHEERHTGAQPLYDAPLCPYCTRPLDVVGVRTDGLIDGHTAVALWCSCGYGFNFQNDNAIEGAAFPGARP